MDVFSHGHEREFHFWKKALVLTKQELQDLRKDPFTRRLRQKQPLKDRGGSRSQSRGQALTKDQPKSHRSCSFANSCSRAPSQRRLPCICICCRYLVRRNKVDAVFKPSAVYHTPRRPPASASLALLAMACGVPSTVGFGLFVPATSAFMPAASLSSQRPTLTNSW